MMKVMKVMRDDDDDVDDEGDEDARLFCCDFFVAIAFWLEWPD